MTANILVDETSISAAMRAVLNRERTSSGLSSFGCDELYALVQKLQDMEAANVTAGTATGVALTAVAVAVPSGDPLLAAAANDPNAAISGPINAA